MGFGTNNGGTMKTVRTFPHRIREIEHCWIPLIGGERLSARIWLPDEAGGKPVPAVLEYIPYRKRDYSAVRDQTTHAYLAGHGYAGVRVDVRGCGDSDGFHSEQWSSAYDEDALQVLSWIAAQPWCDGNIAMMGLSWGGQTCLKMASLAPPELKAVIAVSAADDRYENKYLGGSLLINSVVWSFTMVAQNSRPPDPATSGEGWRNHWLERLDGTVQYIENWVGHQRWDDYWASGSVVDHYGAFGCPVYSVGGAADPGYAVTVPRLLENLDVPVKGLIGPWAHKYPHFAVPGPAIGFLEDALRWFDRWLKDETNGIEDEPRFRAWMHEFMPPAAHIKEKKGRWVEEPGWPSPNIVPRTLALNPGHLVPEAEAETAIPIRTPQSVGSAAGEWMPWLVFGEEAELATDQREDDGRSVVFDTPPLEEPLEILGRPVARLDLTSDKPVATVVVRLCDVAPDGTSMRVAYGALNLTRRDSLREPQPVEPGKRYSIEVPLYVAAHAFAAGHRIRVALSTTYWPVVWPAPEDGTLTLFSGASTFTLPVRPPRPEDAQLRPFGEAEAAAPMDRSVIEEPHLQRTVTRDVASGTVTLTHVDDGGVFRIDAYGLECGARTVRHLSIRDDDPLSARVDVDWTWTLRSGDWDVRTHTTGVVTCTLDSFEIDAGLEAFEGETRIFERTWKTSIPRDLL